MNPSAEMTTASEHISEPLLGGGSEQPVGVGERQPNTPERLFSATGAWPGEDPRHAAAASFCDAFTAHQGELSSGTGTPVHGLCPFPLLATPAEGGTRLAVDGIGAGIRLLEGLPVDMTSYGWRLSRGAGHDMRRENARFTRTVDALAEYGEGYTGTLLWSLPGPWALVYALSLPDGNRALTDHGAVRDVIGAYAAGLRAETERIESLVGMRARLRFIEPHLDAILTGGVKTVSGLRTIPAISDKTVIDGLAGVLRYFPEAIITLPRLSYVTINGYALPHTELLTHAGAQALCVPTPRSDTPRGDASIPQSGLPRSGHEHRSGQEHRNGQEHRSVRAWEYILTAQEENLETWVHIPPHTGTSASASERTDRTEPAQQTIDRTASAKVLAGKWLAHMQYVWRQIGFSEENQPSVNILTGWELPQTVPPLLPKNATPQSAQTHYNLAHTLTAEL